MIPFDNSFLITTALVLILNFSGRLYFVFPEPTSGPWRPWGNNISNKFRGGFKTVDQQQTQKKKHYD